MRFAPEGAFYETLVLRRWLAECIARRLYHAGPRKRYRTSLQPVYGCARVFGTSIRDRSYRRKGASLLSSSSTRSLPFPGDFVATSSPVFLFLFFLFFFFFIMLFQGGTAKDALDAHRLPNNERRRSSKTPINGATPR